MPWNKPIRTQPIDADTSRSDSKRVIIVDDDDLSLELLANSLRVQGYDVISVNNAEHALRLLRKTGSRLVISDWEMPGMSGLDLCREIRREIWPGYVYIILLTSHNQTDDVVEGLSAGADDFISKPFNPAELYVRIRGGERVLALETRDLAIFAMAKLAESRDPETGMHLERIRKYARALARVLMQQGKFPEIDDAYVHNLYLTSPLHDIGKVAIPDSVLLKPDRLSDEEFEIMKTHSIIGAQTLGAAAQQYPDVAYLVMARDIAMMHHERFDGSGYPTGLKGDEIPLCGRITALADVYDALTSKRVYKEAFAHTVARNIIIEESGSHFDPVIVSAFTASEEEFKAIRAEWAEESTLAA